MSEDEKCFEAAFIMAVTIIAIIARLAYDLSNGGMK